MNTREKQSARLLFFDMAVDGHHVEYLYHLINYRVSHPECPEFVLFTHPDFVKSVEQLNLPTFWQGKGVRVIHPSDEEMQRLAKKKSIFLRAKEEFRILKEFSEKHEIKCCHLMALDHLQFALGSDDGRYFRSPIRGILFAPYALMEGTPYTIYFSRLRKHLQILWMLRNRKIEHIYILNNIECAQYFNERYRLPNFFVPLPDPILLPPTANHQCIKLKTERSRYRFLMFGSLSTRKGVFHIIDALYQIPEFVADKIEVVFAGKMAPEDRTCFRSRVTDLLNKRSKVKISIQDKFIPFEEIPALFLESDCILLPYTITHGSSGIIGHSALYHRPIIGSANGLIGKLIRDYRLGIDIKPVNGRTLMVAMMEMLRKASLNDDISGMQMYIEEHGANKFVKIFTE